MSPQPQPVLTPEEIETEIFEICNDIKRNHLKREYLEQNLERMIQSHDIEVNMNGYFGFAHLATTVDKNFAALQKYMKELRTIIFSYPYKIAHYYAAYSTFLLSFDKKEAKEKLLLALNYPITIEKDFQRIISPAIILKDDELIEKILDKCKTFSNTKIYMMIQRELIVKKENLHKIEQMALFEENWNGNGGEKFTPEAIVYFKNIIQKLDKQPDIAPTGRNSLFIQYELNNNILAFEIAINKTEKVYVPNEDYSHAQVEQFDTNVISKIQDSVKNFYEQE